MLDVLAALGLVGAVLLGYRRGILSAAAGLIMGVVGLAVGYRIGSLGQGIVESWTGLSPLTARLVASMVVFLAVMVAGRFLIGGIVRLLGPFRVLDRIGGGLLAGATYVLAVGFLILALTGVPLLPSGTEEALDQSQVVELVRTESTRFTPFISRFLGDRLLESYVNLDRLQGDSLEMIEGAARLDIPPTEEVTIRPEAAFELWDKLNLVRLEEGQEPLAWSEALADIAAGHGAEMYADGYLSHVSPVTGQVGDRLAAQGIPFRTVGENLALNPTLDGVHAGLIASPPHRNTMLDAAFTRVGISVHDGPFGLIAVQVFTG